MKRYLHCLLLLGLIGTITAKNDSDGCCRTEHTPEDSCDYEITSRSYLSVRPNFLSHSPMMISGFRNDRLRMPEESNGFAAQAVLYGSFSSNERDLARYFFPFGKSVLIVDERIGAAGTMLLEPQDLLAQHFNIFTNTGYFRSEISIRPEQKVVGIGLHAKKAFWVNEEKGRGFYTSLALPIERVKNDLQFVEKVINDGGGANLRQDTYVMANMTEAFMQSEWMFGKIDSQERRRTGVADLEFKVGYEWIQQEPFHIESYVGLLLPTARKPKADYMFDAVIGQGHHVGVMWGNHIGVEIWRDEAQDRTLRVEYAGHSQYLFRNTQCRSLDLVDKPWSRYMEMYRSEDQATVASTLPTANSHQVNFATPGINILTVPLKVRPGFSFTMNTAAVLRLNRWVIEGGYNFFCRQAECVKLACPWCEGPAIKHQLGVGQTNPARDMTGNYRLETLVVGAPNKLRLQDYKFNYIKQKDLDLVSATSPAAITSTIYATLGYRWDDLDWPTFGNIGASYEFSSNNNGVLERWGFWAKLGISI